MFAAVVSMTIVLLGCVVLVQFGQPILHFLGVQLDGARFSRIGIMLIVGVHSCGCDAAEGFSTTYVRDLLRVTPGPTGTPVVVARSFDFIEIEWVTPCCFAEGNEPVSYEVRLVYLRIQR